MSLTSFDVLQMMRSAGPEPSNQLDVRVDGFGMRIMCNDQRLALALEHYFRHVVCTLAAEEVDRQLELLETSALDLPVEFHDWAREPGKIGRKDTYHDLAEGRVLRKAKTGMVFLQTSVLSVAAGPCRQHESQVINFINSQLLTVRQQQGWTICHAAACERNGSALAFAGFSGGGKSTLMLHMMDHVDVRFMSNDRLLIKSMPAHVAAVGIPKLPRINPGTALNNSKLQAVLPGERRSALQALSTDELWDIEEKYDVDIEAIYGPNRICHSAPLTGLVILNWQRDQHAPCELKQIDIAARPDLLAAVMKSPGPFYHDADGQHLADNCKLDQSRYLAAIADVPCFELTGGIDFARAVMLCSSKLE